jgi:hypothetical protein
MSTINGIGSTFVGCSDARRDGSYITTKWIIFLIPIVPLSSYRVRPVSSTNIPMVYSSTEFETQSVSLHWPQVLKVYATYLAAFLFFTVADHLMGAKFSHKVSSPLLSAILAFAFAMLAMGISGFIRKGNIFASLIVMAFIVTLSVLVAGNISRDSVTALNYMYFFWGAYAVFSMVKYLGNVDSANKKKKARR